MGIGAPGRKRRNGLAAFRAVEPDVRAALEAGSTLVAFYEPRREQLAMSYAQFARYAQALRRAQRIPSPSMPGTGLRTAREQGAGVARPLLLREGPPRGRPEDAVPTLDMDKFAAQTLKKSDLI